MDQRKLHQILVDTFTGYGRDEFRWYLQEKSRRKHMKNMCKPNSLQAVWSGIFFLHEDMSQRDISLLHVGSKEYPTSAQAQKSETGVELQTSAAYGS